MFQNISKKIKGLATVISVLGFIVSIILGIVSIAEAADVNQSVLPGITTIVLGCLISWAGSFVLYGFGQLIESVQNIENKLCCHELDSTNNTTSTLQTGTSPFSQRVSQNLKSSSNSNVIKWRCPKCHTPYMNEVKRCDVCGTDNPEYK